MLGIATLAASISLDGATLEDHSGGIGHIGKLRLISEPKVPAASCKD
jgi:hypothetical protein